MLFRSSDYERKLELIGELFNQDLGASNSTHWYKLQSEIADSLGKDIIKIKAYANIARVHFNKEQKDSLFLWIDKTTEACHRANNYEFYFNTQIFGCMWYVRNKNFTVASNMILSIQDEAERMNSYEGKVGCFQICKKLRKLRRITTRPPR